MPWGLYLARMIVGGKSRKADINEKAKGYWTNYYRMEALVAVQSLLERTMSPQLFQSIDVPVFIASFYKNPSHYDDLVSVESIWKMADEIKGKTRLCNFPYAANHCLISPLLAQNIAQPIRETLSFLKEDADL